MARVTHVRKAQKSKNRRSCEVCRTEIKTGSPYKWIALRVGRSSKRKNFCANCTIRPSHQTTSHHLQALYGAIENVEDFLEGGDWTLADAAQQLEECAEQVEEVSQGYIESADNIEDGFGHETYQSQEIREKAEQLDSFAQDLRGAAGEIENLEDPNEEIATLKEDFVGMIDDDGEPEDEDEFRDWVDEQRETRREAIYSMATDALNECPL